MSKIALYRKYRPEAFSDLIGQEMIVKVLTNQIKQGSISHAYLFCGSRGTGKTSTAKVFARAINCTKPNDGSPCGKCEVCKSLSNSTNLDVVEMDAASNNSVDDIRQLRDAIGYMPAHGKYKVYIIDEVHMLSNSAFNALLKTLEEPPAHVVFILCTTEAHKLPATILSRCMRFDFSLVPTEELASHVLDIFIHEKKKITKEGANYIAKLGEGSVRDSLSIADRCINYDDNLSLADVLKITGASSTEETAQLMYAVVMSNAQDILMSIERMSSNGKNISYIARDLMKYARDLMAIKSGASSLVILDETDLAKMNEIAELTDNGFLVTLVRVISNVDSELRYSISPKIVLESSLLSLCYSPVMPIESKPVASKTFANISSVSSEVKVNAPTKQQTDSVEVPVLQEAQPDLQSETNSSSSFENEIIDNNEEMSDVRAKTIELYGLICKNLRSSGVKYLMFFGEWATITDSNVRIEGDTFVAYVDKRLQLMFSEEFIYNHIAQILENQGYKFKLGILEANVKKNAVREILEVVGSSGVVVDEKGRKIR